MEVFGGLVGYIEKLKKHLIENNLKSTKQRDRILEIFVAKHFLHGQFFAELSLAHKLKCLHNQYGNVQEHSFKHLLKQIAVHCD